MIENQQNNQHYEDEIDLKELVMALWKQKVMIIGIALIFAILAGIFSMFVLSPVYNTNLNIIISMPEIYITRYGEYTLPITTNEQYINLIISNDVLVNTIKDMGYDDDEVTLESLSNRISIEKSDSKANIVQNSFNIKVSADNKEESLKLAEILYDNYIEFMDVMTKSRAVAYYYNNFNVKLKSIEIQLKSNKEILEKNEELLTQISQTINQRQAMEEIQNKMNNTYDYIVLENIINENYTKVESDVISNKQSINSIENSIKVNNEHLEELDKEKKAIQKYYETGKVAKLESSVISVVETSVYLPSSPVAPSQKSSPRNAMNVAIGLVLGGMIAVMVALIKEYWFSK